jgi:hypothetical protein
MKKNQTKKKLNTKDHLQAKKTVQQDTMEEKKMKK